MTTLNFPKQTSAQPPSTMPELYKIGLEQALLASLMGIKDAIDRLPSGFTAELFFAERHQLIFKAITDLAKNSKPYDAVMVSGWLTDRSKIADVGGESYLIDMLTNSPASYNMNAYALQLIDLAARRRAMVALDRARAQLLSQPDMTAGDVIGGAVAGALEAFGDSQAQDITPLKTLMQQISESVEHPVVQSGYDTGFFQLNQMLNGGLVAGQLVVIGARPGMGKTAIALNILDAIMLSSGKQGLFFSMEMGDRELLERHISSVGAIPLSLIRNPIEMRIANKADFWRVSAEIIKTRKLVIDARSSRSPQDILMQARKTMRHGAVACIVVDYLQLMKVHGASNREQEVAECSRALKAIAKDLGCPVIALAQLNRDTAKENRKPKISDIRDSGQIEQDADIIMLLHRDDPNAKKSSRDDSPPQPEGVTDLIIAKHRNGAVGTIKLMFQGQYTRYVELTPESLMEI